jgi:hypothetical protein
MGTALCLVLAGCGEETDTNGGDAGDGSTDTPEPTPTATQTGEPTDTPTAESDTDTPTETQTESPTEAGVQEGETYQFEGEGTSTTDEVSFRGGVITVDFSHEGEMNFVIEALAVEGDSLDDRILVNRIGTIEGGTAARIGNGTYRLNIDASGPWLTTVTEPGTSGAESPPVEVSGEGPQYAGPYRFDGVTEVAATHSGSRNFIVQLYAVGGDLLDDIIVFNEIGSFDGSTSERLDGEYYASISADGEWTLAIE